MHECKKTEDVEWFVSQEIKCQGRKDGTMTYISKLHHTVLNWITAKACDKIHFWNYLKESQDFVELYSVDYDKHGEQMLFIEFFDKVSESFAEIFPAPENNSIKEQ